MSDSLDHRRADPPTRRAIIDILKQEPPQSAEDLAGRLGISAMAVRQHLYGLREERLVGFEEAPRPVGRPAKLWHLTPEADRFFPDGHAGFSLEMIERFIGFDTTSRESNLELIDYVEAYLDQLHVQSMRVYDDDKRKANLYATLGPQDRPGICLSGHTDVVPTGPESDNEEVVPSRRENRESTSESGPTCPTS